MKAQLLILVFFLITFFTAAGQNTQVISGTVIDAQSELPLIGATIEWLTGEGSVGATTDVDGYFVLENVPPGRHIIRISYIGYEPQTIPNIVVSSGKAVILNLKLEESVEQLEEVVVTYETDKSKTVNEMTTVSARTFSVEEVNRYSGGRSDVGRLVANFAGVSTSNDARNDIVIRGNSPIGVLWRLEGIPVPNPNHFSTLGTTGGPVSALNPNLLKNSDFMTGAFPAEYGNALAGVFDLGFRSGNKREHEFMLQMGAVSGVEFMAEGPLAEGKSSYIVAGRYSFVGLASQAGLNVGTNAAPQYEDLSFKIDLGSGKLGQFTLFGIGGRSDIEFLHDELDEGDLFALEDEDSFAESFFGVAGVKHNVILGERSYLRTVAAVSTAQNEFRQERLFNLDTDDEFSLSYAGGENRETRYSLMSYVNKKFNARLNGRAGVLVERTQYDIGFQDREDRPDLDDDGFPDLMDAYAFNEGVTLWQAFAQFQYKINRKWTLNGGLHVQYLGLNETGALEPRGAINYHLDENKTLSLGYGMHHQTQPLPVLLLKEPQADGSLIESNRELDLTRNQHLVLGYDWNFAESWRAKLEAFYQLIDDVPVEPFPSSFSMLNVGADFGFPTDVFGLVNKGSGTNRGLELTVEKFFSKGYYGLLTGTLYESNYEGSDGIERRTAFDNSYVLNLLFGKEFPISKGSGNVITIDTKVTTAGGRRFTPIDLAASAAAGREILLQEQAFSERFDPYFRWDFKVGFRWNSKSSNVSHHFFLDLQNVTNAENAFIRRYNRVTNEVNEVNQIGFFPDFMYRVQF